MQCFRHCTEGIALFEFYKESFIAHGFHVTEHSTISGHKLHYIIQKFISGYESQFHKSSWSLSQT